MRSFAAKERALRRRWQKLCEDAIELAREAGATEPNIYVEADGGFLVVDGDTHPNDHGALNGGLGDTSRTRVRIGWPRGIKADCGAW